ncbi:hypothetical protein TRIP_D420248 [uncultured Paludibacter sp.]|uniref:Uncharacterized protein n=1 Tax=uncultured Paludibacter sp. TaxID=497635 RepID=A0A653AII3_9BACT|nr:hypothetical protein TRIP_D420248 [uncultured Paludibacter sp.]
MLFKQRTDEYPRERGEQFKVQYCNFYDYLKNVTSPANVLNYNTFP